MKKAYRVKKSAEIEKILNHKKSVGDGYFVLFYLKNQEYNHFRFAVSVPKKYGNAVERNLMKRRIREIVGQHIYLPDIDFFIIVKPKSKQLDYQEIKIKIESLFARANILER